jgi:anti-sigma factor RsiW
MRSDNVNELTNLFIDGELDAERQNDLFRHLGECAVCRLFLQGMLKIRDIQHHEQVTFPTEIDSVVLNAASGGKTRAISLWQRKIRLPVPVAIAAILLIVLIGVLTFGVVIPGEQVRRQNVSNAYVQNETPIADVIYVLPEVVVTADSSAESESDSEKTVLERN